MKGPSSRPCAERILYSSCFEYEISAKENQSRVNDQKGYNSNAPSLGVCFICFPSVSSHHGQPLHFWLQVVVSEAPEAVRRAEEPTCAFQLSPERLIPVVPAFLEHLGATEGRKGNEKTYHHDGYGDGDGAENQ